MNDQRPRALRQRLYTNAWSGSETFTYVVPANLVIDIVAIPGFMTGGVDGSDNVVLSIAGVDVFQQVGVTGQAVVIQFASFEFGAPRALPGEEIIWNYESIDGFIGFQIMVDTTWSPLPSLPE